MGDAVLIMQCLANPNKYDVNGTDEHHITVQGKVNADVDTSTKGITTNDALQIQLYLLKKHIYACKVSSRRAYDWGYDTPCISLCFSKKLNE